MVVSEYTDIRTAEDPNRSENNPTVEDHQMLHSIQSIAHQWKEIKRK